MDRPRILFHHIAKTGGTTFFDMIRRNYPEDLICPQDFFDHELRSLRAATSSSANECLDDDGRNTISMRNSLPYAQYFRRFSLFGDHFPLLAQAPLDVVRVSLFRDPLERVVSLYKDFRSLDPSDYANDGGADKIIKTSAHADTFDDFFSKNQKMNAFQRLVLNGQLGTFLADHMDSLEYLSLSPENRLAKAEDALERLDFVGLQEELDQFATQFFSTLELQRPLVAQRLNVRSMDVPIADVRRCRDVLGHEYAFFDQVTTRAQSHKHFMGRYAYFRANPRQAIVCDANGTSADPEWGGIYERWFYSGRTLVCPIHVRWDGPVVVQMSAEFESDSNEDFAITINGRPPLAKLSGSPMRVIAEALIPNDIARTDGARLAFVELRFGRAVDSLVWEGGPHGRGIRIRALDAVVQPLQG